MITFDRLEQIIPSDQALANKALSVALAQITGIDRTTLPVLSDAIKSIQTTKDLPLITALESAVPPSVANFYLSTLAIGSGTNGTIQVTDILGLSAGWVATDAFTQIVEIFSTMNLSYLTSIYQTMANAYAGDYGDTAAGPLIIPSGLPGAGTYLGTEIDPGPPPEYDPTALDEAMYVLYPLVITEIANLISTYPAQTTELNTLFNDMSLQVTQENSLQALINLDYANLQANDRNSIYGFIFSLPQYGSQIEVGGMAWFIENMANLSTQSGQAIIACLREGTNQQALNSSGIYTNTRIPSAPNPPPPAAELLPSEYSAAEASALVIR